jgi:hypothetical protein
MLQNPFLVEPSAARAWAEGFTKGFASISSPEPGENVGLDDIEAFNDGVAAGSQSAITGIDLGNSCIAASEEHGPLHGAGMAINGAEIAHGAWEAAHLGKLAAGVSSIVVALIELAATLPVHTQDPELILPSLGQPMVDALASYGLGSMELFCGAGLDGREADCEICISPLFASFDQARGAAEAMNRSEWLVVSWRTDQTNSFEVVS